MGDGYTELWDEVIRDNKIRLVGGRLETREGGDKYGWDIRDVERSGKFIEFSLANGRRRRKGEADWERITVELVEANVDDCPSLTDRGIYFRLGILGTAVAYFR